MSIIRPNFAELLRRSQSPRVGTRPDRSASPATESRISRDPDAPRDEPRATIYAEPLMSGGVESALVLDERGDLIMTLKTLEV